MTALNWSRLAAEISKMTSGPVSLAEPMCCHTTFRIGGPAAIFARPRYPGEVLSIRSWTRRRGVPLYLLGGGSNLLVSDAGVRGLVLHTGGLTTLRSDCDGDRVTVSVGAGVSMPRLLERTVRWELTGLEPLVGIPGSAGGAVVMNAGVGDFDLSRAVVRVRACDRHGDVLDLSAQRCEFGYRSSVFQRSGEDLIVLETALALRRGERGDIRREMRRRLLSRKGRQPRREPSAGSVFRNPEGTSAGQLIDEAGWKGRSIGGAYVSTIHANFIVNRGDASAEDVVQLTRAIRESVAREFGVELELELKTWGVTDV